MKKVFLGLAALVFAAQSASAGMLALEAGPNAIEGVNVAKSAVATLEGRSVALEAVGAGLRVKKVLFVPIKVYVAEMFVTKVADFIRDQSATVALDSTDRMNAMAIRLQFVRDTTVDQLVEGFEKGLSANGASMADPTVKALLDALRAGGEVREGQSITLMVERNADASETVTFETPKGEVKSLPAAKGIARLVVSLYLGKATDSGVENLKKDIINGNGL